MIIDGIDTELYQKSESTLKTCAKLLKTDCSQVLDRIDQLLVDTQRLRVDIQRTKESLLGQ